LAGKVPVDFLFIFHLSFIMFLFSRLGRLCSTQWFPSDRLFRKSGMLRYKRSSRRFRGDGEEESDRPENASIHFNDPFMIS